MELGNPNFYIPNDIATQFGQFEKDVLKEPDATVCNLENPFSFEFDTKRTRGEHWIVSQRAGLVFRIHNKKRIIVGYATKDKHEKDLICKKH